MSALMLLQAVADTLPQVADTGGPLADTVQTAAERLAAARAGLDTPIAARLVGILGVATMIGIAVALSYDRKRIDWRLVGAGLGLQAVLGLIVLKTGPGRAFFDAVGAAITGLLGFQEQGARFVFGNLVQSNVPVGLPGAAGTLDSGEGLPDRAGASSAGAPGTATGKAMPWPFSRA